MCLFLTILNIVFLVNNMNVGLFCDGRVWNTIHLILGISNITSVFQKSDKYIYFEDVIYNYIGALP